MSISSRTARSSSTSSAVVYDDIGDALASGWFLKRAPANRNVKKGTTKKRFLQLFVGEIRYFVDEEDGVGVSPKGSIMLTGDTEVKVAGRQLAITTSSRFWDLVAIDGEDQAQEWASLIQDKAIGDAETMDIDLLPGHGDFMFKRGKGMAKFADDKQRYFTLVYLNDGKNARLRMNYYVDLCGRGRVPMNKRGFIAIDMASTIVRAERKLQIVNPGFTWQLTAGSDIIAERWERLLNAAIAEIAGINKAAALPSNKDKPPQKPVLAQATAMVLKGTAVPTVAEVIAALEAANGQAAVQIWTEEITNTILAEAYTRRLDEAGQVAGGWFTKPGLLSGKRLWFELDGIHIKYYTQSPGGAADDDQAPQTDDASGPGFALEKGSFMIDPAAEVVHVNGEVDLYVSTPSLKGTGDRFSSDSAELAFAWAAAIREVVGAFGKRSGLIPQKYELWDVPGPSKRGDAADSVGPLVRAEGSSASTRRREQLKSDPNRRLSVYQTLTVDGDSDDEVTIIGRAKVLHKYDANAANEVSLGMGDIVSLLQADEDAPWWEGVMLKAGKWETGWFPSSYAERVPERPTPAPRQQPSGVQIVPKPSLDDIYASSSSEEVSDDSGDEDGEAATPADPKAAKRRNKQTQVVAEILKTEENYVRDLTAIGQNYIRPMQDPHLNLFDAETVTILFSNIEQIITAQTTFLVGLTKAAEGDALSVARCFLEAATAFKLHSTYCSNHPRASEALDTMLKEDEKMWAFFEGCRMILENALSVSALMLKPIQRICQYPMMLKELAGTCEPDSEAAKAVMEAKDIMNDIAIIINEDKRTREEIGLMFEKFDGWKGPPLTVYSSELFLEGPLKKISGSRAQERYFLLFDNLLVIAKKSSVTGRFKIVGTLFTQGCKCESLPDGEHTHGKVSITNGFRLFNVEKQRWYMLIAKDATEKANWIEAFAKDQEKIAQNTKDGVNQLDIASQEIGALHGGGGSRKIKKKVLKQKTYKKTRGSKPGLGK